jgi:succinyl-diaminopimelate desuccinylase
MFGGTKINIVPDYAELEVDFRLIPEQKHDLLIKNLNGIKSDSCKVEVDILKRDPSLQTDLNHPFIQNLSKISNKKCIGLSYATDAVNFVSPDKPIPFIIFGPGDPSVVHKINEYISIEQVFKATELLTKALLNTYNK